jgi:hypothetical protein
VCVFAAEDVALQVLSAIRLHNISRNYFADFVLHDDVFVAKDSERRRTVYDPMMTEVSQFHIRSLDRQDKKVATLVKRDGYRSNPTASVEWAHCVGHSRLTCCTDGKQTWLE